MDPVLREENAHTINTPQSQSQYLGTLTNFPSGTIFFDHHERAAIWVTVSDYEEGMLVLIGPSPEASNYGSRLPRASFGLSSLRRPSLTPTLRKDRSENDVSAEEAFFPFMKLPTELRVMVYSYHFSQAAKHPFQRCVLGRKAGICGPEHGRACRRRNVNKGAHLGNLWMVSKTIYHEAPPIYFGGTRHLQFASLQNLLKFLTTIPHYHRQHITKLSFDYTTAVNCTSMGEFDMQQTFRLLSECPNLVELGMSIDWPQIRWITDFGMGFKSLLKVRGNVGGSDYYIFQRSLGWSRAHRADFLLSSMENLDRGKFVENGQGFPFSTIEISYVSFSIQFMIMPISARQVEHFVITTPPSLDYNRCSPSLPHFPSFPPHPGPTISSSLENSSD
ncbi:MAG: hypothetical protein Q9169_001230 [Polycauliona sp. 2 TL-2023]